MTECSHDDSIAIDETGVRVCTLCGMQLDDLDFEPEWRAYSEEMDKARCHRTKQSSKGALEKLFASDDKLCTLPQSYKKKCIQKYSSVVGDDTVRGSQRKAIAAACMLFVYREDGDIRTSDEIRTIFHVNKMKMSQGMTRYLAIFPDDRTRHVRARDLVESALKKIDPRLLSLLEHIERLCEIARKKSRILNRTSPQLLAVCLVYYFTVNDGRAIQLIGELTQTEFISKLYPQEITKTKMDKVVKEIRKTVEG